VRWIVRLIKQGETDNAMVALPRFSDHGAVEEQGRFSSKAGKHLSYGPQGRPQFRSLISSSASNS
jgi:hypothetical protein